MANEVKTTKDGNIAFERVGELLVVAAGAKPITDETWVEYLKATGDTIKDHGPFTGLLLWWPNNAPTAAQRKMLVEKYAETTRLDLQRRVAVIAESLIIRGAMTAIAWFSSGGTVAKPFSPADPKVPFDWLAEDIKFDRAAAEEARKRTIAACAK